MDPTVLGWLLRFKNLARQLVKWIKLYIKKIQNKTDMAC